MISCTNGNLARRITSLKSAINPCFCADMTPCPTKGEPIDRTTSSRLDFPSRIEARFTTPITVTPRPDCFTVKLFSVLHRIGISYSSNDTSLRTPARMSELILPLSSGIVAAIHFGRAPIAIVSMSATRAVNPPRVRPSTCTRSYVFGPIPPAASQLMVRKLRSRSGTRSISRLVRMIVRFAFSLSKPGKWLQKQVRSRLQQETGTEEN